MNILFVCTGNTCRSPMAEGLAKKMLGDNSGYSVKSAGIYASEGMCASKHAEKVMSQCGIDISEHRAKQLTPSLVEEAHLILTMTSAHKEAILRCYPSAANKTYALGEYARVDGDIPDPFGGTLDDYNRAANDIKSRLEYLVIKMKQNNIES